MGTGYIAESGRKLRQRQRPQVEAALKRYQERTSVREEDKRKLEAKHTPLVLDEPMRVAKRLERLGASPAAAAAIIKAAHEKPSEAESIVKGVGSREAAVPVELKRLRLERVIGTNDFLSVRFMELGLAAARAVVHIIIRDDGGRYVGDGTGIMVSPRLLLTNNHVLETEGDAASSLAEFNFQEDLNGNPLQRRSFRLDPQALFLTSPELDFTLVAVQEFSTDGAALRDFGWVKLISEEGKAIKPEYVNIIQHPDGRIKQVALRENQIVDLLENFMHYQCDTAPGSSGAPVFNDQWEMVALHHAGVPKTDAQGRYLRKDDSLWQEGMGEDEIHWIANEGVRVSRLITHVKRESGNMPTPWQRLVEEMLTMESPIPLGAPGTEASINGNGNGHRPTAVGGGIIGGPAAMAAGSTATWTIPINVSINLGMPTSDAPVIAAAAATPAFVPGAPARVDGQDEQLNAALRELREARRRTYYDLAKDTQDRDAYYQGISGTMPRDGLFRALSDLLQRSHENEFSYAPIKHLYTWVDLQPDFTLKSIYTGHVYTPERIIEEDLRIERERATRLREIASREAVLTEARLEYELSLLEAALPYNCEHVVPQSWFAKKEPMRGDLHHLFTCDSRCNSYRSNRPYYDFPDFEAAVRDGCGKADRNDGGDKFEPANGKGPVARATLYFMLRYPGKVNSLGGRYDAQSLQTLLEWHEQNPVSDFELHRNQAIYAKQGNRNPLIDHPDWARNIGFVL